MTHLLHEPLAEHPEDTSEAQADADVAAEDQAMVDASGPPDEFTISVHPGVWDAPSFDPATLAGIRNGKGTAQLARLVAEQGPPFDRTCSGCGGSGGEDVPDPLGMGSPYMRQACSVCGGDGTSGPPFDADIAEDGLECFSPDPIGVVPCERCDCAPCTCGGGNVVRLIERTPESALKYWRELAMRKVTENAELKAKVERLKAELAEWKEAYRSDMGCE